MTQLMNPDRIVAVDTETTGLEPRRDELLEIAMVVLDNDLNELGVFNAVVPMPELSWKFRIFSQPEVRDMHERSGLIEALRAADEERPSDFGRLSEVEADAMAFVREYAAVNAPLLGSNVGFDRGFLVEHMPDLAGLLHYRPIDVSSFKEAARRHSPAVHAAAPRKQLAHRALADIRESIAEYRFYLDCGFIRRDHQPTITTIEASTALAAEEGTDDDGEA